MLSPASLRVCCLAVMAPALTKADRQADCLPVVLSESFCGSKTPDTYTIKDKICENRFRCAYSSEYTLNKRRPFMRRACWRTQKSGTSLFYKYRTIPNVSSKSLLYSGKVRTQKEAKYKTWLSTKATTAYAGKIKLKYTMNKNTSNARNMGLAKANMSFGLQSLKKMKQFSKENQSSGPINVIEDSMNYSDSADSPVPIGSLITDTDVTPMDNNILSCVSGNVRVSTEDSSNAVLDTNCENNVCKSVTENDSEPFLSSAGADEIKTVDMSQSSVTLTDSLSQNLGNLEPPQSISTSPCSYPVSNEITDSYDIELPEQQELSVSFKTGISDSNLNQSDLPEDSRSEKPLESIPLQVSLTKERMSIFSNFKNFKPSVVNGKFSSSPMMASSIFSMFNSSKLLSNASRLSSFSNTQTKCSVIPDNRFGLKHTVPVRNEKNMCCLPSKRELDSVESMLADKSSNIRSALGNSTRLLQKQLISHIRKQISSLVDHYQRKLQIPCQRPARHVSSKSHRDLHEIKAELLQSEDVKSMSTAALVNLVRKLESSGSQSRILPLKATALSNSPDSTENVNLTFDSDSIEDIKSTSGVLKSAVKDVLKVSDPYLTESSEEEYESESEDDEDTASDNENESTETSALWNYMSHRTKLGSRSTWLLARVHELEFRIKEYNERLHELEKVEGKVSFSSLPVPESESDVQKSPKQATGNSFVLPLNGFLDCSDTSHVAVSTSESCQLESLQSCPDASCRTRPLNTGAFRKRKVVILPGLHASNPKLSRLSSVNCNCNSLSDLSPCILCTGQYHSLQTVDPDSMALRDRISILDPYFHPALSKDEDIPLHLHFENILKTSVKYQTVRPASPEPTAVSEELPEIRPKFSDIRSHRKLSRYARTLSAKYRNKHHRNAKHLRKHKLVFGKWRRLQAKHALRSRNRFRRHSIASSGSSPESLELSPVSMFDDGLASENKKRQESQFDIDDVIIPCNSRSGRLVTLQYKDIMIPSWRNVENEVLLTSELCDEDDSENISDVYLTKRHDALEVDEKEKMKRTALGLNRRARRNRCDSRADSSGANTPDPTSLYNNQENVFLPPNFSAIGGPSSPPPPPSPNSASISDDSQPPFGNGSIVRPEKRKISQKRSTEEISSSHSVVDYDEEPPYEPLQFPLPDEFYEQLLAESDHNKEVFYLPSNASSFPASPISSSSSTSTVEEEDDDITDPEWTVIKPMRNGPEQALVLKFAKR